MTDTINLPNSLRSQPDANGHFGSFGGRYVAETLMPLIIELERVYKDAKADPTFDAEFAELLRSYVGRPNPLYYAGRLTEALRAQAAPGKGAKIYLKREELNHTGAHKINNCIGQALLAAWARRRSSPKPARASMASPPRPSPPCSAWNAKSSWAQRTSSGRSPTCSA
jgi:tryptophan synthase beta chain